MRFFRTLVTALLLFFAVIVNAQQGPSITINGEPVQQQVVRITFSGDNAVLHFSDGSQLTAAMQELVLQFEKGTSTIIEALKSPVTDRFLIQGLPEGTPVTIYDTQGKTVLTTTAIPFLSRTLSSGIPSRSS